MAALTFQFSGSEQNRTTGGNHDPRGLGKNGGTTQTIALLAGSPVIDTGTSAGLTGTLTTDQRGFARTVDNSSIANANGGDGPDIGAVEFGAQ